MKCAACYNSLDVRLISDLQFDRKTMIVCAVISIDQVVGASFRSTGYSWDRSDRHQLLILQAE